MSEIAAVKAHVSSPRADLREQAVAFAGLLLAAVLFGGYFVAGRHGALMGLLPADLVSLRYIGSGLLFAPFVFSRGIGDLGGVGWLRGTVLTFCAGAPYALVILLGLHFAPAAHGAVLNPSLTPISGILLSRLILGDRIPRGAYIGIPITFFGLILVAGAAFWSTGPNVWLGDAILVCSGTCYGLFTVVLRRWQITAVSAVAAMNVLSTLLWIPAYGILTGFKPLFAAPGGEVIGQILFQGVLAGGLAVVLYVRAIPVLGASRTSMFPALTPVFGTLLAALVLDEHVSALQMAGIATVVLGMLAALWRPRATA